MRKRAIPLVLTILVVPVVTGVFGARYIYAWNIEAVWAREDFGTDALSMRRDLFLATAIGVPSLGLVGALAAICWSLPRGQRGWLVATVACVSFSTVVCLLPGLLAALHCAAIYQPLDGGGAVAPLAEGYYQHVATFKRYALMAVLPLCLGLGVLSAFRGWPRDGRPRCACGYDLTGNQSGICPECGTAVKPAERGCGPGARATRHVPGTHADTRHR